MKISKINELKKSLEKSFSINQLNKLQFRFQFGEDIIEVPGNFLFLLLEHLKKKHSFDFLMDICGVDYPAKSSRFEVVYHLFSSQNYNRLRIKTFVSEGEPVDSIIKLWKGADWFEREIYDMYGIKFNNHPNLRRILTHHQFKGHPLRKDYETDRRQSCSEALPIFFDYDPQCSFNDSFDEYVPINIGPSHPAMHGTLRIMAQLDGEIIVRANVEIGYLHRCFEKIAETHPYNQVIPYTDRLNYNSAAINNVAYCQTVEKLMGINIPPKAQVVRIILCEFSRIIDHLIAIGTGAVDLGAITGFFHTFHYRELVYNLFESLCGSRLTVSLTRIGGLIKNVPEGWFDDVLIVCKKIKKGIDDVDRLLTNNKIFINRTQGIAKINPKEAIEWGYTGPLLRASGFSLDLRKAEPYDGYEYIDFDVPIGSTGDLYDRYLVRMEEMRQSVRIIEQLCRNVPGGDYSIRDKKIVLPEKKDVYGNIEGLMNHFMLVIKGLRPPKGETYHSIESPNGELGFYLVSDSTANPYRLKVRAPSFAIFQSFPQIAKGLFISDAIATVASMNIIAGELDR